MFFIISEDSEMTSMLKERDEGEYTWGASNTIQQEAVFLLSCIVV